VNQSTEDYIKAIYTLGKGSETVSTSSLANHLGIGDGSVTDMVKRLSSKKLIEYTPYKGVNLTPAGRALAVRMVRRHRLWEMFLVQYLGYAWDEIHEEAERLEHATSDELDKRLDRLLGHPKFDPHGDPIPDSRGSVTPDEHEALTACRSGDDVTIVRVTDDGEILRHVTAIGIRLNKRVKVKKKLNIDGSMQIKVGSKEHFISREIAAAIFVRKSNEPHRTASSGNN
jgi:DtxR family Mn-dependent transcriptional regulator